MLNLFNSGKNGRKEFNTKIQEEENDDDEKNKRGKREETKEEIPKRQEKLRKSYKRRIEYDMEKREPNGRELRYTRNV